MLEQPDRVVALGEDPGPPEDAGDQGAEGGGVLRRASEAVAVVSASALVGGGIGMLGGVWLGAINPFALGIIGAAVGAVFSVLLAVGIRGRLA